VQSIVDVPLCIDSSIVAALQRGLGAYEGKALVNSVTGEDERLETVLPLVKKHNAAVIAISNDETGISDDPDERFAIAKKIVERAMDYGIPKEDVIIDPLVMPVGAKQYAGRQVFHIIRRVREELGCNAVCGASNVSFGLPNRKSVNATFIPMLMAAGMTLAITNPLEEEIKKAIMAADALMGNDENCANWIQANAEGASAEKRRDRRAGRRRQQAEL
jgi:5-methyltetrahydrofolate--homocysteine methyltransferase